ncbi:MAG: Mth938-like domain-containing protein [Rhodospirillaceae bacterium]|nr:Mth938-like domain-containing protein [Rhodospirillaceae bacterium]
MIDITPQRPAGLHAIDSYQPGWFRIAGQVHEGSVIVFPDRVVAWPVTAFADVTADTLADVMATAGVELLLIGTGAEPQPIPKALRAAIKDAGIGIDAMATPAACRTYNILLSEHRAVAAALIAL